MHQGVEAVLANLQKQYWIVGARRLLRSITERCVVYKAFTAQAASEVCPPLPSDRVVHQKAFGLTGIDYAGPLLVKNGDHQQKIWVCLFVCGTTRAVHLEIVESLSTEAFLLAFRRFVARRGKPLKIRSDNARRSRLLLIRWMLCGCLIPLLPRGMVGSTKGLLER